MDYDDAASATNSPSAGYPLVCITVSVHILEYWIKSQTEELTSFSSQTGFKLCILKNS